MELIMIKVQAGKGDVRMRRHLLLDEPSLICIRLIDTKNNKIHVVVLQTFQKFDPNESRIRGGNTCDKRDVWW